jgi:hypothetical protein
VLRNFFYTLVFISSFTSLRSQDGKHAIKLNLFALPLKTISLQYEYARSSKNSLLCQFGYTAPKYLLTRFNDDYKTIDGRKIIFRELKFNGGFQLTPELRHYFSDRNNSGFYLGAYLRYTRYVVISKVDYEGNNFNAGFTFKGTFTSTNLGFITGYQWLVGRHFVIDWWILSFHAGGSRFRLKAVDDFEFPNKPQFLEDLDKALDDVPLVRNVATDLVGKDMKVGFAYSMIGTRLGLCLGYKF